MHVEREDPLELVESLQSQIQANAERLRRTRRMVAVVNAHLDETGQPASRKSRKARG